MENFENNSIKDNETHSQLTNVDIDASILSIGGNCP